MPTVIVCSVCNSHLYGHISDDLQCTKLDKSPLSMWCFRLRAQSP